MMATRVAALLDRRQTVWFAMLVSLLLGLFFTFVWAPHPWGWQGIDHYHGLASRLARGEPFATTDVPWGYAYYGAIFYWLFGEHVLVPVVAQVIINAAAPLLLYRLAAPLTGRRTATLAALILGVFSFNTIYASTQASDAVCTVLFLSSLLVLVRGVRRGSLIDIAIGGLLSGLVPQFRPNMILLPAIAAAGYVLFGRTRQHLVRAIVFSLAVTAALTPWIVRNYRLTNTFMPTSTHGGVQLWYGTLQMGPYLERRAHNPRSIFEHAALPYTSIAESPVVINAIRNSCTTGQIPVLVYWSDRDPEPRRVTPFEDTQQLSFRVPAPPLQSTLFYFFEAPLDGGPASALSTTPPGGAAAPSVLFVDDRHVQDLDRRQLFLDVFDLARMARHVAWQEAIDGANDLDGNGTIDAADLNRAAQYLIPEAGAEGRIEFSSDGERAALRLGDGSRLVVPRQWGGRQTDLEVEGNLAGALALRSLLRSELGQPPPTRCPPVSDVRVNAVFYRAELHAMRRYMALAKDNISRAPLAFAAASAYRIGRLFIIRGSDDVHATHQFSGARLAFGAGTLLSAAYFLVFVAGAVIAVRRRMAVAWLLVPVAYVPLTICFVLTNMRYTITMQPLMFVFVAMAMMAALGLDSPEAGERSATAGRDAP